jgi:hypothetical protein
MFVFIDESGDVGVSEGATKYFVLCAISTDNQRVLEKTIRKIWRNRTRYHFLGELHATKVDDSTRRKVLNDLAKLNLVVDFISVKKKTRELRYYDYLTQLLQSFDLDHKVVIDSRDTKVKRNKELTKHGFDVKRKGIHFEDSKRVHGLQAVDFIAWVIHFKLERGDSQFYDIIAHQVRTIV